MSLGSDDHKHDYPERGWQGSKPVSPAGKPNRGYRNRCSPLSDCAAKPKLER